MLTIVYESNERQLEIIEDLLRVARVDAGKVYLEKSSSDVVRQVEAAIQEQAALFKSRGQTVVLNKPSGQVVVLMDRKLMLMVFANLLDNAGKYSHSGGQVTVGIKQTADHTTISVADNGVGLRQSDRKKLFEKFSRIDNPMTTSVKGTGLGLYWAKKVLDLHEGSIDVTSKLNQGSTFVVTMPAGNDPMIEE